MSSPVFLLQIVHTGSGQIAKLPGGGALESDLIDLFTRHILAKGVSFKSQAHVEADIREGLKDALMSLKDQTKFLV